ncbi:MAG: NAD(P)/FAD-dependent oxidoreductase [bacterium]
MAIRIFPIPLFLNEDEAILPQKVADILGIPLHHIQRWRILKKSLDARQKKKIHFVYALEISMSSAEESRVLSQPPNKLKVEKVAVPVPSPSPKVTRPLKERPIIIGSGPAGLFCAWQLVTAGLTPLIIERGKMVEERIRDVAKFWAEGILNPESNVQFGEGGAGTFSDGKLFTRLHTPLISQILEIFVRFGAPAEITYWQKPHIGTDRLRKVIAAMREWLKAQGVEFQFQTKLTGLKISRGQITGVIVNNERELPTSILILAIGHSARDTFQMLYRAGVAMEPKPYAMGVRIEHPQNLINKIQYGPAAGHPALPPAEYALSFRTAQGRPVYSFCMCPGGAVIAASSEEYKLVTNGMSMYRRNSPYANSALVVGVNPVDFPSLHPLAGIEWQRQWEGKAYQLGGGRYRAPAQSVLDFLQGREATSIRPTSFKPGITPAPLEDCLPKFVVNSLREALPYFHKKMPGFSSAEAMLIGVETRTSSPVRITRGPDFQSLTLAGLYPIGEGSGYAGGIISSALDGLKAAKAIVEKLAGG